MSPADSKSHSHRISRHNQALWERVEELRDEFAERIVPRPACACDDLNILWPECVNQMKCQDKTNGPV